MLNLRPFPAGSACSGGSSCWPYPPTRPHPMRLDLLDRVLWILLQAQPGFSSETSLTPESQGQPPPCHGNHRDPDLPMWFVTTRSPAILNLTRDLDQGTNFSFVKCN